MGERVSAAKPDNKTAPARVIENSTKNFPIRPLANETGAYTATRVSVIATIAKLISRIPL